MGCRERGGRFASNLCHGGRDVVGESLVWSQRDQAFFWVETAAASKNPMFGLIVTSFHVVTRQIWRIGWVARPSDADRLDSVAVHEATPAAILERNPGLAVARVSEHLNRAVAIRLAAGIN